MTEFTSEYEHLAPQFIATVEDADIGLKGYVVIDSTIRGHSCGGVRMFGDVTLDEIKGLARSMTLKYGFNGMAQGGAKAGIVADPEMPPEQKKRILHRWGEITGHLLTSRAYITGTDMNVWQGDIDVIHAAAGFREPAPRRDKGNKSGLFTAYGVMVVTEAAAEFKGLDLSGCSVAVEGFGSVGSAYAMLMAQKKGAKVVAISTTKGAIYNPDGLDVEKLLALKQQFGHGLVEAYDRAERIGRHELLTLDVDLLAPCARIHSIHEDNAQKIKAPIICPGANIPVTRKAAQILFERGIVSIPDFTANWGGVLGNKLEALGVSDDYVESFFRKKNKQRIIDLLSKPEAEQRPLVEIAEGYALARFRKMKREAETRSTKGVLKGLALQLFNSGIFPEMVYRPLAPAYFDRALGRDEPI